MSRHLQSHEPANNCVSKTEMDIQTELIWVTCFINNSPSFGEAKEWWLRSICSIRMFLMNRFFDEQILTEFLARCVFASDIAPPTVVRYPDRAFACWGNRQLPARHLLGIPGVSRQKKTDPQVVVWGASRPPSLARGERLPQLLF